MARWWILAMVMGCTGQEPEGEEPATASCDEAAQAVKAEVIGWAEALPAGPPMPDAPRLARLPAAGPDDTLPETGHTVIYDTSHPSGKPTWLMNKRPIAEPGELPEIEGLTVAMAELDARELGRPAPLVLHIPAAAPLAAVMALLRPLAEQGWTDWQVLRVTSAGRTLTPKPPAPAGIDTELEALAGASPMAPGGAPRSQSALRRLFMDIQEAGCDTTALDAQLRQRGEAPDAVATWTSLMDAWEACGCPMSTERVHYLSHQALSEHGMRHLVATSLTVGEGAKVEAETWGDWVEAAEETDVIGLP